MTLRLALVIDGKATGAKQALDETAKGVEDLGRKAKTAGDALDNVGKSAGDRQHGPIEWGPLSKELEELDKKARPAADSLGDVGKGLGETAAQAPPAAEGIGKIGAAAGNAAASLGGFRAAAMGLIGGLAATVGAAALGALLQAAGTAFTSYVTELVTDTPRINRDLGEHAQLVKQLKGAWAEAAGGPSSYGANTRSAMLFATQQDIARLRRDLQDSLGSFELRDAGGFGGQSPFKALFDGFNADLKNGLADVAKLRQGINDIAKDLPADSPWRQYAEDMLEVTGQSAELQQKLQQALDLYKGLTGDAEAAGRAIGISAEKFAAVGNAIDALLPKLAEYDRLQHSIGSAGAGAPAMPNGASGLPAGGFAAGGFTGHMPADQVAGFVHGGEYVFDAATTARIGVGNLARIHRGVAGFAAGGAVYPAAPSSRGGYGGYGSYGGHGGDAFANEVRGAVRGILDGLLQSAQDGDFRHFWDAFARVGLSICDRFFDQFAQQFAASLSASLGMAGGGGGGGGLGGSLGGLVGQLLGGSATGASLSPGAWSAILAGGGGLYDVGGYTGPGPRDKVAGVVHAGEVVWSQDDVARAGGAQVVDAMRLGRRGYAAGGTVAGDGWSQAAAPSGGPAGAKGAATLRVILDEGPLFRATVRQESQDMAVEVVRANDRARDDYWRAGGDPH